MMASALGHFMNADEVFPDVCLLSTASNSNSVTEVKLRQVTLNGSVRRSLGKLPGPTGTFSKLVVRVRTHQSYC